MERLAYDDFEVVLERVAAGLTARVSSSPVGPTRPEPVVMPGVDVDGLRELVRLVNETRGVARHEPRVTPDLRDVGSGLFEAVFRGAVLRSFRDCLAGQSETGRGLRLRVRLTAVPELAHLPWEVLYDPERHRFPSQYAKYPTVRQVDVPEPVPPLAVDGGMRMLVVTASPTDLGEIDGDQEWRCLTAALRPHIDSGRLVVTRLPVATLDAVREALQAETYHVFHFTGHGGVDPESGEGVLAFTDRYGRADWVPGHDLGVILSNAPVRLALLNSCDGARVSEVDPYATTAITLVENGIPAVVAMQFEISDKAAIAFSNATYLALTSSQPVDAAVTLARQAILTTSRNEWATPVLYLRATDGTLFAWDRDVAQETARVEALSAPLPQPPRCRRPRAPRGSSSPGRPSPATPRSGTRSTATVPWSGRPRSRSSPTRRRRQRRPTELGPAYSVVAVDELGRRSPTSDEFGPPPMPLTDRPSGRRIPRALLIGAVVVLLLGVFAWVARGIVWPPDPTPPTPTTGTTSSTTTSATDDDAYGYDVDHERCRLRPASR